jgi:predicted DNA-binding antitoxin AbrB/MazE fold protein
MTYRGRVKNGVVVLDQSVKLPEGAEVRVDLLAGSPEEAAEEEIPPLYERLEAFVGKVHGLPSDASLNLDHYLYGIPKQA